MTFLTVLMALFSVFLTDGETKPPPPEPPKPRIVQSKPLVETLVGVASHYGGSKGFHGIAHVAMHDSRYTGRINKWVIVSVRGGMSAKLPVVDYCDCYVGTPDERVVDLSDKALEALHLDPSRGIYHVTVKELR